MVRCENPARAGPFGGCVPVQMANTKKRSIGQRSVNKMLAAPS
jgi:hypothetical protein